MWESHLSCKSDLNNSNRSDLITLMTAPKLSMVLLYEYYILSVLIQKMNTHTIYTHFLYFQFHQYLPVTFYRQIFWSLIVSTFVLSVGPLFSFQWRSIWHHVKTCLMKHIFNLFLSKTKSTDLFGTNRKIYSLTEAKCILKNDLKLIPLCFWYWFHLLVFPLTFSIFDIVL